MCKLINEIVALNKQITRLNVRTGYVRGSNHSQIRSFYERQIADRRRLLAHFSACRCQYPPKSTEGFEFSTT